MSRSYRFILFALSISILFVLGFAIEHDFSILVGHFWFSSGLMLLILLSLIDQPHFSKDANVFVNSVTGLISLLLVKTTQYDWVFWLFVVVSGYLLLSSYVLMWIRATPLRNEGYTVQFVSRLNRQIGRPESLFSAYFLWAATKQFGSESTQFNLLLWFWIVFMLLNVPLLASVIETAFKKRHVGSPSNLIGQIFGVQSKNTFLVKLLENRATVTKVFDFVEFKYSIDGRSRRGLILDVYLLNQEQWVKVLSTPEIESIFPPTSGHDGLIPDYMYKLPNVPSNNLLETFVGLITEGSTIEKVRFIYSSRAPVFEGTLLELRIRGQKVLYQIVEGSTTIEQLELKNQTGQIVVDAIQLGSWNTDSLRFEQYGWVPEVNTPIYIASNIKDVTVEESEYKIGCIPGTKFPVILNKELAVTHHTAILGVTGSGKSVFCRDLIRKIVASGSKVLCVDFTSEYRTRIADLAPVNVVTEEHKNQLFDAIDTISIELEKFGNQQNKTLLAEKTKLLKNLFYEDVKAFMQSDSRVALFELPDVSNSTGILEYTKWFFRGLFQVARQDRNFGKQVCVVLEEAHTIVPEWNFVGAEDKKAQSLVNSISQIALQGRKYNVGFVVVAQRTANVSKTILTQCNTIIAFQQFDKTSGEFLTNYMGSEMVSALSSLRFRHAIAVGKAFRSGIPVIFEVPMIIEPAAARDQTEPPVGMDGRKGEPRP